MTSTAQILAFDQKISQIVEEFSFMNECAVLALVFRELDAFAPGLLDNDKSSENYISAWIERDVLERLAKLK